MHSPYRQTIMLLERLHRRFLDVVKYELDHLKISDINNVQTLILHNIGDEELTVSELTNRGFYLGSNVSYNVKKLVENGYLLQKQAEHDKRSTKVRLSEKGLKLCSVVDALYERNVAQLKQHDVTEETLEKTNEVLRKVERYWSFYLHENQQANY
jgi:DNA-binding MarR family transcriptional regulator